jgi:hypothetical protein
MLNASIQVPKKPSRDVPKPSRKRESPEPDRKKRIPIPGRRGPARCVPPDDNPRKKHI